MKNWKTMKTIINEEGEETPVWKYDPHHDETIDIRTGEVIKGH